MQHILIIEDEEDQRNGLVEYLTSLKGKRGAALYNVYAASDGAIAQTVLTDRKVDLIVSDLMLPDLTGIEIIEWARLHNVAAPFLILTGQPSIETAVQAIQAGASDYLVKPVDLLHLKKKIEQLLENSQLKEENRKLRSRISETFRMDRVVGNAPALHSVLERVRQVSPTEVTVLIEGESGTGKELVANLIHENSPRSAGPFIRVNCGALARSILEGELFGAVKGAYTGADRDRAGLFEAADGGTIFLDEIGELDMESQVRLLRVIEEREVVRLGSTKAIKVDVRIVSATNRSLVKEVEDGRFREDLYYRLAVIRMTLPPLRERKEDIPLLFQHFVVEFNDQYQRSVSKMSSALQSFFSNYHWPGNVRQFRNTLEAMVVLANSDILDLKDLPPDLQSSPAPGGAQRLLDSITPGVPLEEYERAIIKKNLRFSDGNREKASRLLGISERTLYRKIKEWNMEV